VAEEGSSFPPPLGSVWVLHLERGAGHGDIATNFVRISFRVTVSRERIIQGENATKRPRETAWAA